MQDLFGNPIGTTKDFPLTNHRKRQAAILYHYASLDYLKGLIPLIDETILAFHRVAQTAQAQGRDALFTSKRWGVRGTSANADTYGTPFLSGLRETTLRQISDVAFEKYGQTDVRYAWGGLREVDTGWMSDAEYDRYEKAWNTTFAYACNIDYTMGRQADWKDSLLVHEWSTCHSRFEPMPKFRVRTDVQAETGKKPPRTGVYVSQDDPNGALQFAWTGGDYGALGECNTFNDIGLDLLREVGRTELWLNHLKLQHYAQNSRFTPFFKKEAADEYEMLADEPEIAWGMLSKLAFTTRPCKWYFVELVNGEFDETVDTDSSLPNGAQHLRCEAGQPCPADGDWFTPGAPGQRQFKQGEIMPEVKSDYGQTIWYCEPSGKES
jgi:hypothetical protein